MFLVHEESGIKLSEDSIDLEDLEENPEEEESFIAENALEEGDTLICDRRVYKVKKSRIRKGKLKMIEINPLSTYLGADMVLLIPHNGKTYFFNRYSGDGEKILLLSPFEGEMYRPTSTSSDCGDVGIGTWGDKGYF